MTTMRAELPVAVFDSGVGGLTVLHELLVSLPTEDYLYLGDTARFPYGDRSAPELAGVLDRDRRAPARRGRQAAGRRVQLGQLGGAARAGGASAPDRARRRRDRRAARRPPSWRSRPAAADGSGCWRRRRRSARGAYERAVRAADPHVHLESVACPDLGPIIEAGLPVRRAGRRDRARLLRAAARRRGRHGDPRLHPLSAGRADAAADARPRRHAGDLGLRRGAQRRAGAGRARAAEPAPRRGHLPLPVHRRRRRVRALGTRFLQMPLGEVVHVDLQAASAARA